MLAFEKLTIHVYPIKWIVCYSLYLLITLGPKELKQSQTKIV